MTNAQAIRKRLAELTDERESLREQLRGIQKECVHEHTVLKQTSHQYEGVVDAQFRCSDCDCLLDSDLRLPERVWNVLDAYVKGHGTLELVPLPPPKPEKP